MTSSLPFSWKRLYTDWFFKIYVGSSLSLFLSHPSKPPKKSAVFCLDSMIFSHIFVFVLSFCRPFIFCYICSLVRLPEQAHVAKFLLSLLLLLFVTRFGKRNYFLCDHSFLSTPFGLGNCFCFCTFPSKEICSNCSYYFFIIHVRLTYFCFVFQTIIFLSHFLCFVFYTF